MKVGVGIFATDYTIDLGDLAVMAEESGFESLLVPEHTHIPLSRKALAGGAPLPDEYYHTFDPFVSLSLLLRGRSEFSWHGNLFTPSERHHYHRQICRKPRTPL